MLLQARKERVAWFYEVDRVQKGPKVSIKKTERHKIDCYGFVPTTLKVVTVDGSIKWHQRRSHEGFPCPVL